MTLQVREYATLTCAEADNASMDYASISTATFDWLLSLDKPGQRGKKLVQLIGRTELKLSSYVGFIQAPSGESLEILPKTEHSAPQDCDQLRVILQKMVRTALGIKHKEAHTANLLSEKQPLHEWVFAEFLKELAELTRRGLRFDYQSLEDQATFVRGQLDMNRQMRQTPDKATSFHVRYAEFTPARIENRLLCTALDYVLKQTKNSQNWRLANTLRHQLIDIKPVADPLTQMFQWVDNKLLLPYRKVKPWCQLILAKLNPNFQKGKQRGIALLFPMEELFEKYLGECLKTYLQDSFRLIPQAASEYLVKHTHEYGAVEKSLFRMEPDFLIKDQKPRFVLDAKWKLLDARNSSTNENTKYGIQQADLYQLFSYGKKEAVIKSV